MLCRDGDVVQLSVTNGDITISAKPGVNGNAASPWSTSSVAGQRMGHELEARTLETLDEGEDDIDENVTPTRAHA